MNKRLASILAATAMTLALSPASVFAADYTLSAENNGAPTVRIAYDAAGEPVVASSEVQDEIDNGDVTVKVTSWKDRDAAQTPDEVTTILNDAYQDMKGKSNEELFPGMQEHLDEAKAADPALASVNASDLKIADLFDVSLVDQDNTVVAPNGDITLNVVLPETFNSMPFLMYHNYATGQWEYVPVTKNADGTYQITVKSLSPMVILVAENSGTQTPIPGESGEVTPTADTTGTATEETAAPAATTTAAVTETAPATQTVAAVTTADVASNGTVAAVDTTIYAAADTEAAAGDTTTANTVDTASDSNIALAGTGAAIGLVGVVLVLKARKSLAR